ncbi:19367_t:CDS:2 [Funneliformis geosporum]|uniref:19367_t:CDS:1 n=1 Tax=Funneliformis geosporum TaxID=1117311 RepID=A0A9W4T4K3_9GLOM|nr:19367_t:CDS:2 [Funneliformis geosporum]
MALLWPALVDGQSNLLRPLDAEFPKETKIHCKIYPNYAIQITNQEGLQIIIDVQTDRKNPMPLNKILQCEVQEGQIVNPKTVLFIVYLEEQVISVSVYIP